MRYSILLIVVTAFTTSCTKLDQNLNSTLSNEQASNALGANGTQLLLQTAYNDVGGPYSDPGNILALEEVTADECVVPTRAGDWDDNGKWRALKQHTFGADGIDIIINQFNSLNKLNFDATNVLAFNPTKSQAAEARFLRALALYQLLDLFGQYPFRNPGDNLLNAPKVYSGDSAVSFIIDELNTIIPDLPATNGMSLANVDAANMLLMKLYLNRGAFVNRQSPSFDDADMQKVITLGTAIMNSGKYSYNANYFDNFSATNSSSKEGIFAYPNTSGVATNNSGIHNRWWATLHYNSYKPLAPQSGWNGFSTVADFYNTFGVNGTPSQTPADTSLDQRIGGRFYKGVTDVSGLRTGLLIGQQRYEDGSAVKDRKGNPLIFNTTFSADLKETGPLLEDVGIRVLKYLPDFSGNGKNYGGGTAGNWCMIFRYPDVVLMVAEAKMRASTADNAGALTLVNQLRTARGAATLSTMTLVNPDNVYDPKTLLAERGRELYWEIVRRTDLIRFGVFMKAWALKSASDATHLVFAIPSSALAANPNLKQNPGY
ncbi:MAG: RagB/SusD family nutrient uptake outer membrane protein [Chitinophagaceae bacterium]|nr:RagB/SusD family nutrient uptake outer membrane protein [Chitinophagaceae bacterium]